MDEMNTATTLYERLGRRAGITRITSGFRDQRTPSTSLRVEGSIPHVSSALMASSMTAMNSCSLIFIPLWVASMCWPL